MNRMLNYVWYSFKIVCWLYFEKNWSRSFKYLGCSSGKLLDNKVDNECTKGNQSFMFLTVKILKLLERKKCTERNKGIDTVLSQISEILQNLLYEKGKTER